MESVILTSSLTAFATTIGTKAIEAPIQTLNNLWEGAIGHTIAAWSEKRRLLAFQNVEKFKQELTDEINDIPIEFIQEPKVSIVGPALEASKYYFEEDDLRKMFAKLIASSMDSRKDKYVQHSFVEIIKQLTPLDAKIIRFCDDTKPIVELQQRNINSDTQTLFSDFFVNDEFPDSEINAISLNNLARLGIIKIQYGPVIADETVYSYFNQTVEYKELCKIAKKTKNTPQLNKGIFKLTNLGHAFKSICML